jgi:alkylation response protein AidB-like acyl-CoA dehydrogenase
MNAGIETPALSLAVPEFGAAAQELRQDVRRFIDEARAAGDFVPRCDAWLAGFSADFSRELGRRGWVGMTWPARYGGHERTALERFVVAEELLAAGAPVAAHWIADRQSGPQIYRHGTEAQRERFLPDIARGVSYFSLGMSEPDSGSDLASVRTTARRVSGGWRLNGTKVWTSHAHHAHYVTVLCRTAESEPGNRHSGLSIMIVDLAAPGVTVRPIQLITGEHHFNEVMFQDVLVPDDMLLGEEGAGWRLVTAELSLERSGPERFLSTFALLPELMRVLGPEIEDRAAAEIGRLIAELCTLRQMSASVAAMIDAGQDPVAEAALVKDLGTRFEQQVPEVVRLVAGADASGEAGVPFARLLSEAVLAAPGFTLRGGTTEILRGITARALGVR